jgi:hypothetical protein
MKRRQRSWASATSIVLFGIYAGLRISAEALTLKVENVDIGRKQGRKAYPLS